MKKQLKVALHNAPKGKATGPDGIFSENVPNNSRNQFGDYHSVRLENWRVREMPGGMADGHP